MSRWMSLMLAMFVGGGLLALGLGSYIGWDLARSLEVSRQNGVVTLNAGDKLMVAPADEMDHVRVYLLSEEGGSSCLIPTDSTTSICTEEFVGRYFIGSGELTQSIYTLSGSSTFVRITNGMIVVPGEPKVNWIVMPLFVTLFYLFFVSPIIFFTRKR